MRKLILGILILVVVLVGVAVALPFVLPRDMIKAAIAERVSAELGREVTIEGPLTLRPWRPFAVTLGDVRLANPEWASEPSLARIERVELEVDALAYLDGTVVLERLLIERPTLALERRADGTVSWQLATQRGGPSANGGEDRDDRDGRALPELRIGEIRVTGGSVAYEDRASGERRVFEDLELWARGEAGSPALLVDGGAVSDGERASVNARIGDLNRLLAGEPSTLALELAAPGLGLAAEGEADPAGGAVLAVSGDMAPRRLLDWLGQPLAMPAGTLEAVTLAVDLAAAPAGLEINALALTIDDLAINGDLALAFAERPRLTGSLDLGELDLRPYQQPAEPGAAPAEAPSDSPDGWPTDPLDLPLPLPLDVDLAVAMTSLTTDRLALGATDLGITADAATTTVEIRELALYDGGLVGAVSLTGDGVLGVAGDLQATDVQLRPLLTALADIDRFAGTGNLQFTMLSRGQSVDELVRNLAGDGAVLARDGAILGINIAATIRQVTSLGAVSAESEPPRTDFAEAGGSFTIADGVLENEDFALRAPVLRVTGEGTVDLGERTLAYRLLPRLAATLEGQDAAREGAFQAGVPLLISGPWSDPAIRLDMAGVLSGDIGDPAALSEAVRNLASDPGRLQDLQQQLGIDPGSALGGALEGLGGLLGRPSVGDSAPADRTPDARERDPAPDPVGRALESLGDILGR